MLVNNQRKARNNPPSYMKIPLLDLQPQLDLLREEILQVVTEVIDSKQYILGPQVEQLEETVAEYCGTKHAVGVSSGTDALLISLMGLDIGPGDLIVTTPYSFFATMGSILRTGARPVFVDIDPYSYNISTDHLRDILSEDAQSAKRIKAVLPVHLYGQCADMSTIMEIADRYDKPVIEDAAQAIGAEYPFLNGGTTQWKKAGGMGLAGCFSFFPSKNLGGIGDGGMVVTSDSTFADKLRSLRNHGSAPKYYHSMIGGNFRLDPIQAAVLKVKLPYLENWHQERRKNSDYYGNLFREAGLADTLIRLPEALYKEAKDSAEHNFHIYNQFVIKLPKRDDLREYLGENDIGCEIYYPLCLHQQACLHPFGYDQQSFPEAEKAAAETLALPIYPELTEEMQEYVVSKIAEFYR